MAESGSTEVFIGYDRQAGTWKGVLVSGQVQLKSKRHSMLDRFPIKDRLVVRDDPAAPEGARGIAAGILEVRKPEIIDNKFSFGLTVKGATAAVLQKCNAFRVQVVASPSISVPLVPMPGAVVPGSVQVGMPGGRDEVVGLVTVTVEPPYSWLLSVGKLKWAMSDNQDPMTPKDLRDVYFGPPSPPGVREPHHPLVALALTGGTLLIRPVGVIDVGGTRVFSERRVFVGGGEAKLSLELAPGEPPLEGKYEASKQAFLFAIPAPPGKVGVRPAAQVELEPGVRPASAIEKALKETWTIAEQVSGATKVDLRPRATGFTQGCLTYLAKSDEDRIKADNERFNTRLLNTHYFLGSVSLIGDAINRTLNLHRLLYMRFLNNLINFAIEAIFMFGDWGLKSGTGKEAAQEAFEKAEKQAVLSACEEAETRLAKEVLQKEAGVKAAQSVWIQLADKLSPLVTKATELAEALTKRLSPEQLAVLNKLSKWTDRVAATPAQVEALLKEVQVALGDVTVEGVEGVLKELQANAGAIELLEKQMREQLNTVGAAYAQAEALQAKKAMLAEIKQKAAAATGKEMTQLVTELESKDLAEAEIKKLTAEVGQLGRQGFLEGLKARGLAFRRLRQFADSLKSALRALEGDLGPEIARRRQYLESVLRAAEEAQESVLPRKFWGYSEGEASEAIIKEWSENFIGNEVYKEGQQVHDGKPMDEWTWLGPFQHLDAKMTEAAKDAKSAYDAKSADKGAAPVPFTGWSAIDWVLTGLLQVMLTLKDFVGWCLWGAMRLVIWVLTFVVQVFEALATTKSGIERAARERGVTIATGNKLNSDYLKFAVDFASKAATDVNETAKGAMASGQAGGKDASKQALSSQHTSEYEQKRQVALARVQPFLAETCSKVLASEAFDQLEVMPATADLQRQNAKTLFARIIAEVQGYEGAFQIATMDEWMSWVQKVWATRGQFPNWQSLDTALEWWAFCCAWTLRIFSLFAVVTGVGVLVSPFTLFAAEVIDKVAAAGRVGVAVGGTLPDVLRFVYDLPIALALAYGAMFQAEEADLSTLVVDPYDVIPPSTSIDELRDRYGAHRAFDWE